ncbi:MAG: glycoside hydrolase family 88 protein [Clostridia bacterium]|nr:glycoside hydrolase family 88 protein [Clostridia bacterium]
MSCLNLTKQDQTWVNNVWEKLDNKLSKTCLKSRYKIPYSTVNGEHDDRSKDPLWWTNGFWGGLMWLMYIGTQKECYRETAEIAEKTMDRAFNDMVNWHHDVGFMWHITSGVSYRLTGNEDSKNRNILAAMSLMSRYNVTGEFIRCWNTWHGADDVSGWTIVDCMMNIPILYWASEVIGDSRFKKVAVKHADMTMRDHVREDGCVNHIVVHDTEKPNTVLGVKQGQGYAEYSCWSRGASWALYGFVLSFIHTKEERYLDTAKLVAKKFILETEKTNWLPRLDFMQPQEPLYYDSTAGAIACCGLIELSKLVEESERDNYLQPALNILKAMESNWCNWLDSEDSILQMGSEMYTKGIHVPIIYGDYFFTEAILKLKGSEFLPW